MKLVFKYMFSYRKFIVESGGIFFYQKVKLLKIMMYVLAMGVSFFSWKFKIFTALLRGITLHVPLTSACGLCSPVKLRPNKRSIDPTLDTSPIQHVEIVWPCHTQQSIKQAQKTSPNIVAFVWPINNISINLI